ncbi:MAG: Betaine aldehyde dehydrogenase [Acidimicrobiales bacterium]|nr:MAG: aldehyde dehydrogenase family protein [Actinomycetota bacterium]MBV6508046.1 Betaine aldehyde dehydrogenase [Acidimicrobiales bacterium]RIK05326.1 MAG: hypothetical protein DCC48_10640 [Acidobacteriota bacterium]
MLLIDGALVSGDAGTYAVRNPVRPDETVDAAPSCSPDQLDDAVASARLAGAGWAATALPERIEVVRRATLAAEAAVAEQDLAELLTREQGKVLQESIFDVGLPAFLAETYSELAPAALNPRRIHDEMGSSVVQARPRGVVAAVLPFNWPVSLMANKVVPALIAGNTLVLKPPPTCPLALLEVVAAMGSVLPPGVINTVNGPDAGLGRALVAHPGIDMISFTGGVATGRSVLAGGAEHLNPVVLELGGNDPAILAPDVAVDENLAGALAAAAFLTAGQVCMAIKRLYVPEDRLADVVEALVVESDRSVVGDGLCEDTTMGPLHTAAGRDRLVGLLEEAEAAGAKVHRCGRVRPEDERGGGFVLRPAIVEGAPPDCALVREEQFGPALPVLTYRDLDEAVARANDTDFGLCASVWSSDEELAAALADRLDAGTVFINNHGMFAVDVQAPFGGWKQSGLGRELGPEGLLEFTRSRTITNRTM